MKFVILIFFILCVDRVPAQQPDTLLPAASDSVYTAFGDSLIKRDTAVKKKSYDVDSVIYASSSDSLFFYVNKKKMDLYGNSKLRYKDTDLKSGNIFVDFNTSNVYATGVPSDSVPGKFKETPVLSQNGEVYDGRAMTYNYKTTQGFIQEAKTKTEGAIYSGQKIKKVDRDTYFIKDGIYTTCDADPPHYYFFSPEMKVIQKKEMIAKWIWLYFGGVPFPIPLPFAVFPLESGRRSGILPPAFGQDATKGFYFSHFGYYWAINDYVDLNMTADYYTRGSFGIQSRFRYNKRYGYSGSLQLGYRFVKQDLAYGAGFSKNKEWSISWNHQQTFTPTMRLSANLQFLSGKNYIQSTTNDLNTALNNTIYSNLSLNKTWDESGNSLNINYSRSQDLESGNITELLPSVTFSIPHQYPFKRNGIYNDQKWYELIGFDYTGTFQNRRTKTAGNLNIKGGIQHSINASASPKIGYFNISPNISYTEDWYNKRLQETYAGQTVSGGDSVISSEIHQINLVRTFRLGVSASTKFYGMFQPNILGISAIRHIVTPSLSYNFTPDYSKPGWGYFGYYTNSKGQEIKYNKFQNEIFGGPTAGEQQNISFSLGNVFEMKTSADPTDTTSKVKKFQLLNLNASMSYNFAADSLRFSDLSLSYRTQIGDILSFNGSTSFSPYDYSSTTGYDINKFLINEGKGFLRLRNFGFSVSTSLSGQKLKGSSEETPAQQQNDNFPPDQAANMYQGIYNNREPDFSIPWNMSLSYNYSYSKSSPFIPTISSNMSANIDFNLTPKWKFSVAGSYDFRGKQFSAPQIRISRDLHAWIMNFTWNPIGTFTGYYLEIRIKAPQLQDLKLTKRGDFYNGK